MPEQPKKASDKAGDKDNKTHRRYYSFGTELVEFMQKSDLIEVSPIGNINEPIRKKVGKLYVAEH